MMSIRSLADFNRSSLGGDGDWLTPPPSPPRPCKPGRHDERGMGTFNWPPARTATWPYTGTFSWPRTRVAGEREWAASADGDQVVGTCVCASSRGIRRTGLILTHCCICCCFATAGGGPCKFAGWLFSRNVSGFSLAESGVRRDVLLPLAGCDAVAAAETAGEEAGVAEPPGPGD